MSKHDSNYSKVNQPAIWNQVDNYINTLLIANDKDLEAALETNAEAGLPSHDVTPNQGKFLQLLLQIQGASRVLEIGTLGAYSTIWMARALPEHGRIVSLESEPKHAEIAKSNLNRAGLMHKVDLRVGPALTTLPDVKEDYPEPFDLIFIDADKPSNPDYLRWALRLTRPGSLIIGVTSSGMEKSFALTVWTREFKGFEPFSNASEITPALKPRLCKP